MTVVNDSRFEDLLSQVADSAKVEKSAIMSLIQEKKTKVGAGYLTDQGALFLVASDLGVGVDYDHTRPPSLAQLDADARSISVIGRVLSLGIPKPFARKGDSSKGLLSKLILYDSSGVAVVSLWNDAVLKLLAGTLSLRPSEAIKITDAYTRAGLDGKPELNVGEKGRLEKLASDDPSVSKIRTIERLIIPPSSISDGGKNLVVRGKISGEVRRSNFSRSDGTASNLTSFSIGDELANSALIRVVVWNNLNPGIEKLREGDVVTLLNVRAKISNFQNTAALEIHGDETTTTLETFDETREWMFAKAGESYSPATSAANSPEEKQKSGARPLPFIARVISKKYSQSDRKYHLLLLDSQKRKVSVTASDDATKNLNDEAEIDSVVLCKPDVFDQGSSRVTCTSLNSISKVSAKRPDIPDVSSMFVKVEEIPPTEGSVVSLELICLSDQVSREIQTKEGLVKRSEITAADHTGEVKVFGWRNLSKMLEGFSAGDRMILQAVETQVFEGRKFLVLKNYSNVEKKPITG